MENRVFAKKDSGLRVAMLNPPMDFDTALGKATDIGKFTVMIPQGLASMASLLRENGMACSIIDAYAEGLNIEQMIARISEHRADILGISAVTPVMPVALAIAVQVKKRLPAVRIVMGGPHPSILPDEALADGSVEAVVRGEGELTLLAICRAIEEKRGYGGIKGVSYRENGRITHNEPAGYINDLDELPRPAYDLLPMHLYTSPPQWSVASPSFQLSASRGCPFNCGFCCVGMGRKVRCKSARNVCDEIEYLVDNHNCRQIVFVDTTFPFNERHSEEVCGEMIRRGLNKKIVWFTSTRVDIVNPRILGLMRKAGCRLITYGVESGDQRILDSVRKGISLAQVSSAVDMANKAGIDITASYILGLPGESADTIRKTIAFAKRLNTLYAQFNVIVPYPGTQVYDYAEKNGLLRNKDWNNYVSLTSLTELDPPFIAEGMTKEGLLGLQKKAYNSFYLRPAMVARHLGRAIFNMEFRKYLTLARVMMETFK